jgi:hypothetical protein
MPNAIKYSTTIPTGSLLKGTVALGVTTASISGPTSTTGWYYGPNPVAGKYQIIETAVSGDPDVYCPQSNAELIQFVKTKGATGANTSSLSASLAWIGTQSNLMAANFEYENIVTSGLVLNLDAGFVGSYPTTASTWYDISGNNNSGSLVNSPTFNSANSGSIVFDGVDDYVLTTSLLNASLNPNESVFVWFNPAAAGQIVSELGQATIDSGYHDSNIEVNSSGIFSFSVWHNGLTNKVVSSAKSFNNWYHLGFTYSGTTFTAYINGSSIGTTTFTRQPPSSLHYGLCSIDSTNMGTSAYGSGKMGNFMFYNRGLSSTEVLQNFNALKGRFGV